MAAWAFKGLRIDNLPRTMWYTPQHGFSCALGLIAVPVAITAGLAASRAAILLSGCALGASVAFNPLLGAAFCGVYGLAVLADLVSRRGNVRDLLRHGLAVMPVALALAWCQLNAVGEGAGDALHIERELAITQPVIPSPMFIRRRLKISTSSPTTCAAIALPDGSSTR